MERSTFILSLAVLFFIFTTGLLLTQFLVQAEQLSQATELSASTKTLIKELGHRGCAGSAEDYATMRTCTLAAIEHIKERTQHTFTDDNVQYKNHNPRTNETGYLLLTNTGTDEFTSEDFILLKNKNIEDRGCVISGPIPPGYVCRLDFTTTCAPGDVLEVEYQGQTAYIKNC
ncbi:MAG: hypothetical protein HC945_00975 [Nitrosarchaeum sp.]|nr:hypothetical protein [Nitrosarchaeum sp.]